MTCGMWGLDQSPPFWNRMFKFMILYYFSAKKMGGIWSCCVPKDLVSLLKPVSRLATAVAVSHFNMPGQILQSRQKHWEKATERAVELITHLLLTPGQIMSWNTRKTFVHKV